MTRSVFDGTAPALRGGAVHTVWFVLIGLLGCSSTPSAFGPKYPDNDSAAIAGLMQRLKAAPERASGSIAVGVTSAPQRLFAYDLSARKLLWQTPVTASSAPYLAGESVVVQADGAINGYDLRSGDRRFRIDDDELVLKGADGEGPLVALTIGSGMGTFARSEVILLRSGSRQWSREVDSVVGVPAVVGNTVLVPWSNQFMSALDVQSGDELARVRLRDGVISHALREGDEVVLGSFHGVALLGNSISKGSLKGEGVYFTLPDRPLPGRPQLLADVLTEQAPPAADSAQHRIALAWQPVIGGQGGLALQDDNVYLGFYRFLIALAPNDLTVRWVYVHDRDVVGVAAQPGGLAFADEAGRFGFVTAGSGERAWLEESGAATTVARLPKGGIGAGSAGETPSPEQLAAMLMAAAQDTDARLVPARLMLVEQLARMPQPEATLDLIELCDGGERLSPPVRDRACLELKQRKVGADHFLFALQRHAGYLEGTTSPPVEALAKAVAALKEQRAVAPLIAHLGDPETRSKDLPGLITALGELGDASAAEPLATFLARYHADPIDEHLVRALELTPAVLTKLSGPVARPVLEAVSADELGIYAVRLKAQAALDTLLAQQAAAAASDEKRAAEQEQEVAEEAAAPPANALNPTHLTTDLISQALLPVRDQLRGCLDLTKEPTFQARVVIVVEETKPIMVSVLPKELQACIEPLVKAQTFPRTKLPKAERVTHIVKR